MASIQELLVEVGRKVPFIEKGLDNTDSRYQARGIDQVFAAFHGPLLEFGVLALPTHRFLEGHWSQAADGRGNTRVTRTVTLECTITFVGPEGDTLTTTAIGESSDTSDKAAAQAAQSGYKYAMLQAFAVPTGETDPDSRDGDFSHVPQAPPTTRETVAKKAAGATKKAAPKRDQKAGGITQEQSSALFSLFSRQLQWSKPRYSQELQALFGDDCTTDFNLTEEEAGRMIEHLQGLLTGDKSQDAYDQEPF